MSKHGLRLTKIFIDGERFAMGASIFCAVFATALGIWGIIQLFSDTELQHGIANPETLCLGQEFNNGVNSDSSTNIKVVSDEGTHEFHCPTVPNSLSGGP